MTPIDAITLAAYASLVLELTAFPVPSEASTLQLLGSREPERERDDAVARAVARPTGSKLAAYALPTALGVVAFLIPLGRILLPALDAWVGRLPALERPALATAGALAIVAGRALTFTSVLQVRARRSKGGVQASGLFRWSRNPGLLGMYLMYAGLCLAYPAWPMFAVFPLYVLNMHARVLLEESRLAALAGPPYAEYLERVPRYLGLP